MTTKRQLEHRIASLELALEQARIEIEHCRRVAVDRKRIAALAELGVIGLGDHRELVRIAPCPECGRRRSICPTCRVELERPQDFQGRGEEPPPPGRIGEATGGGEGCNREVVRRPRD